MLTYQEILVSAEYLSFWNALNLLRHELAPSLDLAIKEMIVEFPKEAQFELEEKREHTADLDGYRFIEHSNLPKKNPSNKKTEAEKSAYANYSIKSVWNILVKLRHLTNGFSHNFADDVSWVLENKDYLVTHFSMLDESDWVPAVINDSTFRLCDILFQWFARLLLILDAVVKDNNNTQKKIIYDFIAIIKQKMVSLFYKMTGYINQSDSNLRQELAETIRLNNLLVQGKIRQFDFQNDTVVGRFQNAIALTKEGVSVLLSRNRVLRKARFYQAIKSLKSVSLDADDPVLQMLKDTKKMLACGGATSDLIQKLNDQKEMLRQKSREYQSLDLQTMLSRVTAAYAPRLRDSAEASQERDEASYDLEDIEREEKTQNEALSRLLKHKETQLAESVDIYKITINGLNEQIADTEKAKSYFGLHPVNIKRIAINVAYSATNTDHQIPILSPAEIADMKISIAKLQSMIETIHSQVDQLSSPQIFSQQERVDVLQSKIKNKKQQIDLLELQCKNYSFEISELEKKTSTIENLLKARAELASLKSAIADNASAMRRLSFKWNSKGDIISQSIRLDKLSNDFHSLSSQREALGTKLSAVGVLLKGVVDRFSVHKDEYDVEDLYLLETAKKFYKEAEELDHPGYLEMQAANASLSTALRDRQEYFKAVKLALTTKYIGDESGRTGQLQQYMSYRNKQIRYKISDFTGSLFSCCFGRKTEKELRKEYLKRLQELLTEYRGMDFSNKSEFSIRILVNPLMQYISQGIRDFESRTDYEHSLKHYLTNLYSEIAAHTNNSTLHLHEEKQSILSR